MAKVFLSYASEDRVTAEAIADALMEDGYEVFYFTNISEKGAAFIEKISSELRYCRHFVALLSPDYLSSRWCQAEFQVALGLERRTRSSGRQFSICFAKIQQVNEDQLGFERIFEWLDLIGKNKFDTSIAWLRRLEQETKKTNQQHLGDGRAIEMVEIPGGKFLMGSAESEAGVKNFERPQHEVTVPSFYIGKFTITQVQWRIVAGWEKVERGLNPDPSRFKGDDRPVESVSWDDAMEFCARLAIKTGRAYRLPTEAEWEYACRAGTTTLFAFGETITPEIVNYDGNHPYGEVPKGKYRKETVPVGSLKVANAFGLYDMHGNVWEWCQDVWHPSYEDAPTDGSAWLNGGDSSHHVLRGGSWSDDGRNCRSAIRYINVARVLNLDVGLRVVVSARKNSP